MFACGGVVLQISCSLPPFPCIPPLFPAFLVTQPNSIDAPGPEPEAFGGAKCGSHQNRLVDTLRSI